MTYGFCILLIVFALVTLPSAATIPLLILGFAVMVCGTIAHFERL